MHRRRLAIVAALACWMQACSTFAQTLTVTPTAAKPGEPIVAALTDVPPINDVSLRTITWSSDEATKMLAVDSGQHVWATAGQHWIAAKLDTELRESRDILVPGPNWATDKSDVKLEKLVYLVDKTSVTVRAEFAVEGVVPPTPVPPTPVPPTPVPPGPVPIVETGLRVLIVYDADTKASLPRGQMALLDSPTFRAWLDAHCVRATDGTSEWRIAPHETEFNADQPVWQKAMALPRQGLPWLVVSNGTAGESIPLPANEAAAIALIGRYAP